MIPENTRVLSNESTAADVFIATQGRQVLTLDKCVTELLDRSHVVEMLDNQPVDRLKTGVYGTFS